MAEAVMAVEAREERIEKTAARLLSDARANTKS
jgi:hypothetical protein